MSISVKGTSERLGAELLGFCSNKLDGSSTFQSSLACTTSDFYWWSDRTPAAKSESELGRTALGSRKGPNWDLIFCLVLEKLKKALELFFTLRIA